MWPPLVFEVLVQWSCFLQGYRFNDQSCGTIIKMLLHPAIHLWWDWERWQKEIDWMVLQGTNLPLAFTGQESIWKKLFMVTLEFSEQI
nr:uncharacterized protein LOC103438974 isoform X2 [Malus domestica]